MTSVAEPSGNQYLTTQRSPERAATSGSLLRPVTAPPFSMDLGMQCCRDEYRVARAGDDAEITKERHP
jgi:hypothetical protein